MPAAVCQTLKGHQTLEGQKERVTPAVAGDVLIRFQISESELGLLSLALAPRPISVQC